MSIRQAAGELGVSIDALEELLVDGDYVDMEDLFDDESISREDFKLNYQQMAEGLSGDVD